MRVVFLLPKISPLTRFAGRDPRVVTKTAPLPEGTLRMSNVCDNGNFSFPKECRKILLRSG